MNSADCLRAYTAPRALLVGVLFVAALLLRLPAFVLALVTHVLDRVISRLLTWIDQLPPAPVRVAATARRRWVR